MKVLKITRKLTGVIAIAAGIIAGIFYYNYLENKDSWHIPLEKSFILNQGSEVVETYIPNIGGNYTLRVRIESGDSGADYRNSHSVDAIPAAGLNKANWSISSKSDIIDSRKISPADFKNGQIYLGSVDLKKGESYTVRLVINDLDPAIQGTKAWLKGWISSGAATKTPVLARQIFFPATQWSALLMLCFLGLFLLLIQLEKRVAGG